MIDPERMNPDFLRELGVPDEQIKKIEGMIKQKLTDTIKRASLDDDIISSDEASERKFFLSQMYNDYAKKDDIKVGDYVIWKSGMKNRRFPRYGDPVVVVETMWDEPVYCTEENSGSPFFREPLTLKLGFLDVDGEFVCFLFDGNRFRRYE